MHPKLITVYLYKNKSRIGMYMYMPLPRQHKGELTCPAILYSVLRSSVLPMTSWQNRVKASFSQSSYTVKYNEYNYIIGGCIYNYCKMHTFSFASESFAFYMLHVTYIVGRDDAR